MGVGHGENGEVSVILFRRPLNNIVHNAGIEGDRKI